MPLGPFRASALAGPAGHSCRTRARAAPLPCRACSGTRCFNTCGTWGAKKPAKTSSEQTPGAPATLGSASRVLAGHRLAPSPGSRADAWVVLNAAGLHGSSGTRPVGSGMPQLRPWTRLRRQAAQRPVPRAPVLLPCCCCRVLPHTAVLGHRRMLQCGIPLDALAGRPKAAALVHPRGAACRLRCSACSRAGPTLMSAPTKKSWTNISARSCQVSAAARAYSAAPPAPTAPAGWAVAWLPLQPAWQPCHPRMLLAPAGSEEIRAWTDAQARYAEAEQRLEAARAAASWRECRSNNGDSSEPDSEEECGSDGEQ